MLLSTRVEDLIDCCWVVRVILLGIKKICSSIFILQITIHRDSGLDVSSPKHGKVDPDNMPHVGGNTWAGGTGFHSLLFLCILEGCLQKMLYQIKVDIYKPTLCLELFYSVPLLSVRSSCSA